LMAGGCALCNPKARDCVNLWAEQIPLTDEQVMLQGDQ